MERNQRIMQKAILNTALLYRPNPMAYSALNKLNLNSLKDMLPEALYSHFSIHAFYTLSN